MHYKSVSVIYCKPDACKNLGHPLLIPIYIVQHAIFSFLNHLNYVITPIKIYNTYLFFAFIQLQFLRFNPP